MQRRAQSTRNPGGNRQARWRNRCEGAFGTRTSAGLADAGGEQKNALTAHAALKAVEIRASAALVQACQKGGDFAPESIENDQHTQHLPILAHEELERMSHS